MNDLTELLKQRGLSERSAVEWTLFVLQALDIFEADYEKGVLVLRQVSLGLARYLAVDELALHLADCIQLREEQLGRAAPRQRKALCVTEDDLDYAFVSP